MSVASAFTASPRFGGADSPSRAAKLAALQAARTLGLFRLARWATRHRARILCYHGVWRAEDGFAGDSMFMAAETFARRLDLLRRLGYRAAPLSEVVDALDGRLPARPYLAAITIDDGWHSTYAAMLPELKRRGLPATLYCDTANLERETPVAHVFAAYLQRLRAPGADKDALTTELRTAFDPAADAQTRADARRAAEARLGFSLQPYLDRRVFDYMTVAELRDAAANGLDVQLHTHNHTMHDLTAEKIGAEIAANRAALARMLERDERSFTHFCYPSGVASPGAAEALARMGDVASATTTAPGLATIGADTRLLPRILDGENLSDLEFEAELSGLSDMVRRVLTAASSVLRLGSRRDGRKD